jgi:hypothetical protein
MATKLTVTIAQDPDDGTDLAMRETVEALTLLGVVPMTKVVLTMEVLDERALLMKEKIKETLRYRPVGIEVTIKAESKEDVERRRLPSVTPMDQSRWDEVAIQEPLITEPPAMPIALLPERVGDTVEGEWTEDPAPAA